MESSSSSLSSSFDMLNTILREGRTSITEMYIELKNWINNIDNNAHLSIGNANIDNDISINDINTMNICIVNDNNGNNINIDSNNNNNINESSIKNMKSNEDNISNNYINTKDINNNNNDDYKLSSQDIIQQRLLILLKVN